MKKIYKALSFLIVVILSFSHSLHAQVDSAKLLPSIQVIPNPPLPQLNAGFDVIIKINGDIIYGIVKEVGIDLVTYKRTDIPDGPIYTLFKNEIYAISYRNQLTEYFSPAAGEQVIEPLTSDPYKNYPIDYRHNPILRNGSLRVGLGFIKSFSRVDNKDEYSSSGTFPAINIGYDADFKNQVRLGIQLGFGSRRYAKQDYNTYDSVQNNIDIKENIFSLFAYARYSLMNNSSRIKPYLIGGLGINSSRINSENTINFTNNSTQTLLVTSGTRSVSLGLMARVGAEYYINNQIQAYADIGVGLAVVNLGISFNLK
ncbi:MAG: outer membrane beta-barrel protein [Ferruginibacter sp.]